LHSCPDRVDVAIVLLLLLNIFELTLGLRLLILIGKIS
jgi:hypothetical protein